MSWAQSSAQFVALKCPGCGTVQIAHYGITQRKCVACSKFFRPVLKTRLSTTRILAAFDNQEDAQTWHKRYTDELYEREREKERKGEGEG